MTTERLMKELAKDTGLLQTAEPFVQMILHDRLQTSIAALEETKQALENLSATLTVLSFIQNTLNERK